MNKRMYEVTFCDSGKTVYWSRLKCVKYFGRVEFEEILGGYLPHIVAVEV